MHSGSQRMRGEVSDCTPETRRQATEPAVGSPVNFRGPSRQATIAGDVSETQRAPHCSHAVGGLDSTSSGRALHLVVPADQRSQASMNERLGVLAWSFPLGRLFQTQVRVSWLLPLVAAILAFRLGWEIGLAFAGLLFLSILAHEFGHVFAARVTGGMADEVLLWPLGGLAFTQPGPSSNSALLTIAGGPLVNLAIALLAFPGFYAPEELWGVLNPFELPISEFHTETWIQETLLLLFTVNWLSFLANLVPVYPLDGGQFLLAILNQRLPGEVAHRIMFNTGMIVSILIVALGVAINLTWVVAIGSVLLALNVMIGIPSGGSTGEDDSFMGYDFSQGYTSLERSDSRREREPRPSWYQSWKARRQEQQQALAAARRLELERQLDELLAKVHEHGMQALSPAEQRLLKRASEELRQRSKPSEP
ncbi:hypothetical protein GC163_01565 [bacterium]|nr:hypothetical protein [bacterium]